MGIGPGRFGSVIALAEAYDNLGKTTTEVEKALKDIEAIRN